jgi:hypothetical protein
MLRAYAGVSGALGWSAIVGQYTFAKSTIDYFSFFTILSNLLVALTFTAAALFPQSSLGRFLLRPGPATATAIYITVTGIVYFFLLRHLYDLSGWRYVWDVIFHYVIPPLYALFWLAFIAKGTLHLRDVPAILIPPLVYGAYTLVHGALSGFYPYPFVNATNLGYARVFENILGFIVFFSLVGSIYVLVDRVISHFNRGASATAPRPS